jgi:hypothetical protein
MNMAWGRSIEQFQRDKRQRDRDRDREIARGYAADAAYYGCEGCGDGDCDCEDDE